MSFATIRPVGQFTPKDYTSFFFAGETKHLFAQKRRGSPIYDRGDMLHVSQSLETHIHVESAHYSVTHGAMTREPQVLLFQVHLIDVEQPSMS